jgi:hypothetical protein
VRRNYAILISTLKPDELEEFVDDWLAQRFKDYHSHELWRGTGDMGRDVTGYVTAQRMEGLWDNYQCKQLSKPLSEVAAFVELGKIFMHVGAGAFALPRAYFFVAPRGVTRAVQQLVAHPERFRSAFLERWNTEIAGRLVEKQNVPLNPAIEAAIKAFDFTRIDWFDSARLSNDSSCKVALVRWFHDDPGPSPRGSVPEEIQASESAYVSQLLRVYEATGPGTYADAAAALASPEFGANLREQRIRFFDAVAFERFYRDSTPADYVTNFKEEVYHGVVDTHRDMHANGYVRLGKVMQQAAGLQAPGVLGRHAGPKVKQGTCHQLANEGLLPWDR